MDWKRSEAEKREGKKMCVPCKLDSEGKVLETWTNARWHDFFHLCSRRAPVMGWFDSVFSSHTSSLWSLLSHYPVDVFYLLAQHCHGRQLSPNTETQSLGQRGRFLCTALLSPRMIKRFFPVRTVEAGWHYQFCLNFLLLSRGSRSGSPSDIRWPFIHRGTVVCLSACL